VTAAKGWTALVGAAAAATLPALMTGTPLDTRGWANVAILGLGAAAVYLASNEVPGWSYAKALVSLASTITTVFMSILPGPITRTAVVQMVVAGLATLAAAGIPNRQPPDDSAGRHRAADEAMTGEKDA
jgi:hypothetical protein